MTEQLLVTAVGEDRPGIVARLTQLFLENGGNVEESRMSILGGEFTAMIMVTVSGGNEQKLQQKLDDLKSEGITAFTKKTRPFDQKRFEQHGAFDLKLTGADHEGIVHRVSRYLSEQSINIETMDTETVPAPVTGSPLFQLKARVLVPASATAADIENDLRSIGKEESVEITLTPCSDETKQTAKPTSRV